VIELVEAAYDGPEGVELIGELLLDINRRYRELAEGLSDAERAAADDGYLGEVTPEVVRRPHGAFLVAYLDGQLAGCGGIRPYEPYHDDEPPQPGVAEVKRMYTRARARRRGVSRAVLTRLEELALELGYRRLLLETGSPQPEAIGLYESSGWTPVAAYGHYRHEATSRCFGKDLAG
jgi:GNAT superfamily N-acetyltransferase